MEKDLRTAIIENPSVLLEDHDVMRALVGANENDAGNNVVDLRSVAMERLEARFDRLEDTHRNVIAAAYDNLAGTNQVHRAILRMMDATDFDAFMRDLATDVADTLRVDNIRLVLESTTETVSDGMGPVVTLAPQGFVDDYITAGRNTPVRKITLRPCINGAADLHADKSVDIQSEACLKLDLGPDRLPGLLVLGSTDAAQFTAQQGTDLLTFFAGVFERVMRRWLA
ncbi:DUF484 family protein [Yoonia sp. SS1-5]|uniref:DUF484 family protein n=1 Tax=Yoonia rhodophyticola TaxID=3137370 RepID=A0AAN0NK49_9RHOB